VPPALTGQGSDEPALAAAVEAVPELARAGDVTVEVLTAGITNRNFLLEGGGARVVVRVFGPDTELLGIDRAAEDVSARAAAAAGVAPEVLAFLPEAGCLVTRFVEGEPVPETDLEREEVVRAVVRSVRAIHACPPLPSAFPVFRIVEDYAALATERGVRLPPAYGEAHELAARIEGAVHAAPLPETPCHNDLLNANFLRERDHVWILDYEYAGMGDPFFDLANLSINNGLSAAAQEMLLRAYFGVVTEGHRARLGLMRVMSDLREAMWGVVQQALSTLDVDYVAYADRHFERLLGTARDERLPSWLEVAAAPLPPPAVHSVP
jgi:thiamine kinase-like enzyme